MPAGLPSSRCESKKTRSSKSWTKIGRLRKRGRACYTRRSISRLERRVASVSQCGGCSSGVERRSVAPEVAGSKPVSRPNPLSCWLLVVGCWFAVVGCWLTPLLQNAFDRVPEHPCGRRGTHQHRQHDRGDAGEAGAAAR